MADFEIVSNMLKEAERREGRASASAPTPTARRCWRSTSGWSFPAGKVVKFIVTSNDVIHAFAVPAFWNKIDANPGQLNETWVKVDRPGVYFGQCSELCGARHAYMPIAVEVVSAGAVRRLGRVEGRHHARRPPGRDARQHRRLAGQRRRGPRRGPAAAECRPPAADPAAIQQPATNQAATAQN